STTETPVSTSEDKGKETCKVIYGLRSGREYERPSVEDIVAGYTQQATAEGHSDPQPSQSLSLATEVSQEPVQKPRVDKAPVDSDAVQPSSPVMTREIPPPPFPQTLRRAKEEKQFDKFIEIMIQLHINIPLIEAIQQM
ncbi:hypothetical protein A2U01_0056079, partial [Trifolium medium]|nr:hypothetical protein [Trifolium medium]